MGSGYKLYQRTPSLYLQRNHKHRVPLRGTKKPIQLVNQFHLLLYLLPSFQFTHPLPRLLVGYTNNINSLGQLPKDVAAEIYTTTFYAMFVLQSFLCYLIPFFGSLLNFFLLCWLYSLYCYEYKWSTWHIGRRLKHIEDNWTYFWGFGMVAGLPFTLASVYYGFWISYAVWWLLFPFVSVSSLSNTF